MSSFNPDAAAAAYLDRLPLALRQAAETSSTTAHWLAAAVLTIVILVCWATAKSGMLVAIRRRYEGNRLGALLAVAVCTGVFVTVLLLACAPISLFGAWRARQEAPLPHIGLVKLAAGVLGQDLLILVGAVVFLPLGYTVLRSVPRGGEIWIGAGLAVAIFAASWLPFALASGPTDLPTAPPGAARDTLIELIHETRTPANEIYITNNPADDVDVTGVPGKARVIVSKGLWSHASPAELRAGLGHVMGHFAHHDELTLAALWALVAFGAPLAARLLFRPTARLLGARGIERASDPAGLPVLVAIAAIYLALATVGLNNFIRIINVRADAYSLEHAHEPDGLAQSLLTDWREDAHKSAIDPSPIEELIFYNHPSLKSRLVHAMRWKAAHSS